MMPGMGQSPACSERSDRVSSTPDSRRSAALQRPHLRACGPSPMGDQAPFVDLLYPHERTHRPPMLPGAESCHARPLQWDRKDFAERRVTQDSGRCATSKPEHSQQRPCERQIIRSPRRLGQAASAAHRGAFAVARLITRSNLIGYSTGRSPGFALRRILSTNSAARRNRSG
jgi:hypothetical protein